MNTTTRLRRNWKWVIPACLTAGLLVIVLLAARSRQTGDGVVFAKPRTAQGRFASLSGGVLRIDNCLLLRSERGPVSGEAVLLVWPQKTKVLRASGRVTVSLDGRLLRVPGPANLGGSVIDINDPIIPERLGCNLRNIHHAFLVGVISR
jgi:hypothetical protein